MLEQLTGKDAPSGDRERLSAPAELLEGWLTPIADRLVRHETQAGPVIEAEIDGAPRPQALATADIDERAAAPEALHGAAASETLLLCHYDTVWPHGTAQARPFLVRDGIAYGPGVLDMRGGIVAALGALSMLRDAGALTRPLRLLITPDEESGSAASRSLIESRASRASIVLVPEPSLPGGALKTARKGWIVFRIEVAGRAAHAGLEPERGVSAIDELIDALREVRDLADPIAGTTLNCGRLIAANQPNVVADHAEASIDVRVPDASEQSRVRAGFAALTARREGASLFAQELHARPPMERTEAIAAAFASARSLASLIDVDLREGSAGGVSDANIAAGAGVPVLDGLGPEGGGAHAADEHVDVDSIVQRAALIALLVEGL